MGFCMFNLRKCTVLSASFLILAQTYAAEQMRENSSSAANNSVPSDKQAEDAVSVVEQNAPQQVESGLEKESSAKTENSSVPSIQVEEEMDNQKTDTPIAVESEFTGSAQNVQKTASVKFSSKQPKSVSIDVDAPSYNHLEPVPEWSRYSADSARSLKEWGRWWKYLRMKTPLVMKWIDNFVVRIYPDNEIFRALFIKGIYDPNSIIVINSLLPKDGVFIDVGASFGYFSILATQAVGENGKVIAIEPSSRDYKRLVDNIKINNLEDIVSTYRIAISDMGGTELLNIATEERSALNTLGNEFASKGVEKIATENVDAIALDDFVIAHNIRRVDVIKLDIEGSELKALRGARKTIMRYRPAVMLGVNSNALKASGTDHDEIQQTLSELGYKAYKIVTDDKTFVLQPIPDLTKESAKVVFCLPENAILPVLPQPKQKSITERVTDFFTR